MVSAVAVRPMAWRQRAVELSSQPRTAGVRGTATSQPH
jgi:hypothetical protein